MRVRFVDLQAQTAAIGAEVQQVVAAALERTDWILGAEVDLFEREFADYCEADFAIGVDSGTSALELALRAVGVGPGDEVITAANTFIATALAITHTGADVRLVDVCPDTATIDPDEIISALSSRTKAIVPVHLYGRVAEMDAVLAIAAQHGLAVVEDACQAHGARLGGRRAGTLGTASAFSFYPAKNLGACGDAGAVVTNDPDIDEAVRLLRNYGQREKYHHELVGFNRRLDTIQAAILRVKLRHLDGWNACRIASAAAYSELLAGSNVALPGRAASAAHVWHLYVIESAQRDALREGLSARGIETGVHYPVPIHLQKAYESLGYPAGSFPVAERLAGRILSLPMYPELTRTQVEYVAVRVSELAQPDLASALVERAGAVARVDAPSRAGPREKHPQA